MRHGVNLQRGRLGAGPGAKKACVGLRFGIGHLHLQAPFCGYALGGLSGHWPGGKAPRDQPAETSAGILFRNLLQQFQQDAIGIDPLGLGLEIEDHPVAQGRQVHAADILETDIIAAVQQRTHLPRER